ncbi:hypothetical protein D3C81_2327820 [compost metagenome]
MNLPCGTLSFGITHSRVDDGHRDAGRRRIVLGVLQQLQLGALLRHVQALEFQVQSSRLGADVPAQQL